MLDKEKEANVACDSDRLAANIACDRLAANIACHRGLLHHKPEGWRRRRRQHRRRRRRHQHRRR